jgi:hypothetical protein
MKPGARPGGEPMDRFASSAGFSSRQRKVITMNQSRWWSIPVLLFLFICVATGKMDRVQAQAEGGDAGSGTKRALLIGINKYKAVPKLQGSLNDIETMRQILLTRWGFADRHITVVADEAGTRAGILAALEQLVKDAGPHDTVYFHYSGHGSQVEDLNGDEAEDHLDETLVPQDGRSGEVRDITDDELDAIFARLRAKSALIVLDSCHSGTATRSLDIRTRSIPRDTRVEIYKHAEEAKPKTRAIVPVMTSRYVVMTGAASHQEALDGPVDGRAHGFFTYALSKSLGASAAGASPREVFTGVERELKRIQTHFGRTSMPEPQLEAPLHLIETTLFGTAAVPGKEQTTRLAWLEVLLGDNGLITLVNGPLLGAGPGSTWSIYPPGETRFTPGRALAVATVTQIRGKDAIGTVQSSAGTISAGARAVALLPAPTGQRIPIRILDLPAASRKVVEDTLRKNMKDVELVGSDRPARFSVDIEHDRLRLLAADGLQVVATFDMREPWGTGVATVVSRSAHASELLTLDNPSSQLTIDVRVTSVAKPRATTTARGIMVVAETQATTYHIRQPGSSRTEHNSLQLEIRVNADSYVTIVDVDSEGAVNLLFPNTYQQRSFHPDGYIRAGEPLLIPDSLQPGNKAGFYWDYSPPKGTDTIRVFTSTDLPTAQMIRERISALQAAPNQADQTTRSIARAMQSLRTSLGTVMARGIITVADDTSHIPGTTPAPTTDMVSPAPFAAMPPTASGQPAPFSAQTTATPAADWAATSVTVVVTD